MHCTDCGSKLKISTFIELKRITVNLDDYAGKHTIPSMLKLKEDADPVNFIVCANCGIMKGKWPLQIKSLADLYH